MRHPLLTLAVRVQIRRIAGAPPRDEPGEGVISAAIAALRLAWRYVQEGERRDLLPHLS